MTRDTFKSLLINILKLANPTFKRRVQYKINVNLTVNQENILLILGFNIRH